MSASGSSPSSSRSRRRRRVSSSPAPDEVIPAATDPEAPIDEAAVFYAAVWDETRRIPYGSVTSYGHIAKRLGHPRHSRMVGQALKWLPSRLSRAEHEEADPDTIVPWHRVLNASGKISLRGSPESESLQAELLRGEGVEVTGGGRGTGDAGRVSLTRFGHFPAVPAAPSDDAGQESEAGPARRRGRR